MLLVLAALLGARDQLAGGASSFFTEVAPSEETSGASAASGSRAPAEGSGESGHRVGIQIIDVPTTP